MSFFVVFGIVGICNCLSVVVLILFLSRTDLAVVSWFIFLLTKSQSLPFLSLSLRLILAVLSRVHWVRVSFPVSLCLFFFLSISLRVSFIFAPCSSCLFFSLIGWVRVSFSWVRVSLRDRKWKIAVFFFWFNFYRIANFILSISSLFWLFYFVGCRVYPGLLFFCGLFFPS